LQENEESKGNDNMPDGKFLRHFELYLFEIFEHVRSLN